MLAKGVIKRLLRERRFGFIKTEDGKEVFFYMTALRNVRFDLLKEGDPVEFSIVQGPKGPKAVNIEVKEKKR
jgi:CspA family cold shock protein